MVKIVERLLDCNVTCKISTIIKQYYEKTIKEMQSSDRNLHTNRSTDISTINIIILSASNLMWLHFCFQIKRKEKRR